MFTSQNLIYKENPEANKGAMYCSIILGADKTMVSVAIGHVKYHPLYISLSNFHGSLQCTHHNTVILIGILAISKCMWFKFLSLLCNQLTLHPHKWPQVWLWSRISNLQVQALSFINLSTLQPAMQTPVVCHCPDDHYCRVIFDLVCFIADYPKQVYLSGIIQNWCPK